MGNCGSAPKTKGDEVAATEVPAPVELPKEESIKAVDGIEERAITAVDHESKDEKKESESDDVKPVVETDIKPQSLEALLSETAEKETIEDEEKKPEDATETKEANIEPKLELKEEKKTEAEKASEVAITQ